MTELSALEEALAAEHEIVYGYGLVGAHIPDGLATLRGQALAALDEHLTRRDRLAQLVRAAGGQPTPAAPAYRPPTPVTDVSSAARLAARLEDRAAGAAWDLAAASRAGDAARSLAVGWLAVAAEQAARWGELALQEPPAALPGQPI